MIDLNSLQIVYDDEKRPRDLRRMNWDQFIRHIEAEAVQKIYRIQFVPDNDTILIDYRLMSDSIFTVYIPNPHIKLLACLLNLPHASIKGGVGYYMRGSNHLKEQLRKTNDHENFWDSIRQEDKSLLMAMILGSNDK